MILERTNSSNPDFIKLIKELDSLLTIRHEKEQAVCQKYNTPESIKNVVLVYDEQGNPVACGAIREYLPEVMEVKRMFVSFDSRKKGIATLVLNELEIWALELGAEKCILETGNQLPEAIALYEKQGYKQIPNYAQYKDMESSICFEKLVSNKL